MKVRFQICEIWIGVRHQKSRLRIEYVIMSNNLWKMVLMTSSMMSSPNELRNDDQWDIWRYWNIDHIIWWNEKMAKWNENLAIIMLVKKSMSVKNFMYVGEYWNLNVCWWILKFKCMLVKYFGENFYVCWWKVCSRKI